MFTLENRKISPEERACSCKTLPAVAVSRGGRVFVSYLCKKAGEDGARRVKVAYSDEADIFDKIAVNIEADDGGFIENARVWTDPENRLWVIWSCLPEASTKYCVCADADADELVFGEIIDTSLGTLLARPVVCSDGTYLFGSGVTQKEIRLRREGDRKRGAYVGKLDDSGNIEICNKVYGNTSILDTICLVENGGKIESFVRVPYGIEKYTSADGAKTFPSVKDSGYGSYDARFTVAVLSGGNFFFINKVHFSDSSHTKFTAMLSQNGGRSFTGIMPVYDGDGDVSIPDACFADGVIYTVYAVNDGKDSCIYLSKFTEQDILSGDMDTVGGETKIIFF